MPEIVEPSRPRARDLAYPHRGMHRERQVARHRLRDSADEAPACRASQKSTARKATSPQVDFADYFANIDHDAS